MVFMEYIPGDTIFHRVDVRAKIAWLLLVIVLSAFFSNPIYLAPLFLFVILSSVVARLPFSRIWRLIRPLLPVILFIIIFSGFTYGGVAIFEVLGLKFTINGLLIGSCFVLRLGIFVLSFSVITLTTPLNAFLELLLRMRAPYPLARAFATGIRFVPTMEKELQTVLDAQKVRGVELEKMGFIKRLKTRISALIPIFIGAVKRSENLSIALLSRGFGTMERKPTFYELKMGTPSCAFAVACIVSLITVISSHLIGYI